MEIDFNARYAVDGYQGIAFYLKGFATNWDDEYEIVDDPDNVVAVMVGDDREHIVSVEDLTLLDDDDYCGQCGALGCTHDGRD